MRKRTFILGLVCWLGFFAIGMQWVFNPYEIKIIRVVYKFVTGGHPEDDLFTRAVIPWFHISLDETRKAFPIHMARFENSGVRDYADRITSESTDEVGAFDYGEWAFRESCSRFVAFTAGWLCSGWFVQWLITRIIRGPGRLVH